MTGYLLKKINKEEIEDYRKPELPKINEKSIEYSICLKLNNNKKLFNQFKKFVNNNLDKSFNYKDFKKDFFKYFDKTLFNKNVDDFIYFMNNRNLINYKFENNKITLIEFKNIKFDRVNMNSIMNILSQ